MAQHHGPDLCGASDQKLDRFCSWKDRKAVTRALKPIYRAATIEAAALALDDFETE